MSTMKMWQLDEKILDFVTEEDGKMGWGWG